MADDPYATLGVSRNASDEDVRRAFRKLAKELHPDISKGNEERFKKVSAAYEILGDAEKRRAFDRGEIDGRGEPRHPGYRQYARSGARAGAGANGGFDEFGFGDIFSDIFGGTGRGAGGGRNNFASRGQDLRYTLEVDFLEAALGATKRVTLPGGGMLDLNVPAGVTDAQVLRLKGKGQRGIGAASEPGDALVEVRVRPHPQFKRDGDDILLDLPVTIDEAVLGAKVEVPTLTGRVQLTIPKGTSSGRVLRLKGKGVKSNGRAEAGDQLVTIRIVLPENIDDTLAYFFSEWRQKNHYDPGRN